MKEKLLTTPFGSFYKKGDELIFESIPHEKYKYFACRKVGNLYEIFWTEHDNDTISENGVEVLGNLHNFNSKKQMVFYSSNCNYYSLEKNN